MSSANLCIGRADYIEELVRADAERRGRKIVPGTLKAFVETNRSSKGGAAEIVGPQVRYEFTEEDVSDGN